MFKLAISIASSKFKLITPVSKFTSKDNNIGGVVSLPNCPTPCASSGAMASILNP